MFVKINGKEYEATIDGRTADSAWDDRESKSITLEMDYATAAELFVNDAVWSIVDRREEDVLDTEGNPTGEKHEIVDEWDNSEFCVAGDLTDHRDGTLTAKMGKLTDLEEAYNLMFGGETV